LSAERALEVETDDHWGVFADGAYLAEYHTRQPDPSHWVAVGLVTTTGPPADQHAFPRMLVGAGRTEEAAIHDLEVRLMHEGFGAAA